MSPEKGLSTGGIQSEHWGVVGNVGCWRGSQGAYVVPFGFLLSTIGERIHSYSS